MKSNHPKIKYFDLYGLRKEKGEFLESHDVKNTKWRELELKKPNFWFVPKDMRGEKIYDKFVSVKDIFKKYNAGVATGKDDVLVDFDKQALMRKLMVCDKNVFEMMMQNYRVSKELINVWYDELKNEDIENQIKTYNYRPFDNRFLVYNSKILQRARKEIMNNFLFENIGICITKQLSTDQFSHAFITNTFTDRCYISLQTREVGYIFPLFIYSSDNSNNSLFEKTGIQKTNFSHKLWDNVPTGIEPERVLNYIYAILHSNIYRKKYNEFLKIDFPRVPFAKDNKLFNKISKLGEELADLHLLKSGRLESGKDIKFPTVGDNKAEKREYKDDRIYINDKQYFTGVAPEVWNYHIGGYQVLDKWLKDRKDKVLSSEDVNHYLKVITALKLTIEAQKEIDKLYSEVEKSLIS